MDSGERLSAYVAGELDLGERAELDAELARDPALREQLVRARRVDALLADLGPVDPPAGFSARLHERLETELATRPRDELAARRTRSAWRPLVTAAAAAAVLVVVGLGGGLLLRAGGNADNEPQMEADAASARIEPVATDNDYNDTELQRLAVGVDLGVPPDLGSEEAEDLALRVVSDAEPASDSVNAAGSATGGGEGGGGDGAEPRDNADSPPSQEAAPLQAGSSVEETAEKPSRSPREAVEACLPELIADATSPVILAYVELAKYNGEPAIIYVFAARDPETGEYRRAEVWAVAPADCSVLAFTQYDQPPRVGN